MKRIVLSGISAFIMLFTTSSAMSHSLWINLYESFSHPPGHALSCLGWGHAVPMDDFMTSQAGAVEIETYDLIAPDGSRSSLGIPDIKKEKQKTTDSGMTIEGGELGLRKIGLTGLSKKGTYQVTASSKATYFTGYIDKNGKMKMATKPMDEIKDAKSFKFSTRYKADAKSYMTIGEWTAPKASGSAIEITPLSDLSKLKKGDLAEFEVTLNGTKLNCDMHGMNYLFATSNTYRGPDKFSLCSYIMDGKAQIRIPTAGQWVINVLVKKEVKKDNELKDLYGKCESIYYGSSVSINVTP